MQLKISIVSAPQSVIHELTDCSFEQLPIRIGRSAQCDLVLPDPNKHVSSTHAELSLQGNVLTITDTSSNGTFVNGSGTALGRGNSIGLANGDTLQMGDFIIGVALESEIAAGPTTSDPFSQPFPDSPPASENASDDPFAGLADLAPSSPVESERPAAAIDDLGIDAPAWDPAPSGADPFADLMDPAATPADTPPPAPASAPITTDDDWAGWLGELPDEPAPPPAAPPASHAPVDQHHPAPVHPPPVHQAGGDPDLINVLLEAAGVNQQSLAHVDRRALAAHIGKVLNRSTQGMMLLLRSRDEIKNAMRAEVTLLASTGNNPLKFSTSVEAALESLMTPSSNAGFDDADRAIEKGLQDIKVHQLAMLEAMRSSLHIALSQFDPERLEHTARKNHPIASSLPLAKQAKLWEQFHEQYSRIKRETVDDFSDLFGRELRKAYENSVDQLEQSLNISKRKH